MRKESARRVADLDFDGYGIGGLSVGETREQMLPALDAALAELPTDRPRYLMGVGDPAAMVEAVDLGVDQFDCVMQTRLGRHGTALTTSGRLNVKRSEFALSDDPLDRSARAACVPGIRSGTCGTSSRSASRPRRGWSASTTWPGRSTS